MKRARMACLGCDHTTPAGHGGVISLDAAGERVVDGLRIREDAHCGEPCTATLDLHDEDALRKLLATFAAFGRSDILVCWHLLNGRGPKEIAKVERVTRQAAHVRIMSTLRRFPMLAALYEPMQKTRRKTRGDVPPPSPPPIGTVTPRESSPWGRGAAIKSRAFFIQKNCERKGMA